MRRRRITAATLKEAQGWRGLRPEVSRHRARSGISAKSPMYVNTSAVDRLAVKLASDEKNQPTQYVCLLYTSEAAVEGLGVDLGGGSII